MLARSMTTSYFASGKSPATTQRWTKNSEESSMVKRTAPRRRLIPFIIGLGIFWNVNAQAANEARCDALGANCICSEPMNTNSWVDAGGAQNWNPGDTTASDKQCGGYNGVANAPLSTSGGVQSSPASSGEDITALPAAHTVTWVLRMATVNGAFLGHLAAPGVPTALRAIRFYKYYSTAYNSQGNTNSSCNANKLAQFGPTFPQGPIFTFEGGDWTIYDIQTNLGWNQGVDCCNGPGPGNVNNGPALSGLLGNWWRIEIVMHNAAPTGLGTTFDMYIKNVTANGPELHVLDTSKVLNGGVSNTWTLALATGLHPIANIDAMTIDMFRSTNGSIPCAGFASYSHFLYAAWSTDGGQRIGAAREVEGLAAPTGLRVQ